MVLGHIAADYEENGVRVLIMRGASSLCAYIGIPEDHPLAGFKYDTLPIRCHGGLTFGQKGQGRRVTDDGTERGWPEGYYWYGWDYGHSGDYATYYDEMPSLAGGHKWTVAEVKAETWSVTYYFEILMKLAEELVTKALWWRGAIEALKREL